MPKFEDVLLGALGVCFLLIAGSVAVVVAYAAFKVVTQ